MKNYKNWNIFGIVCLCFNERNCKDDYIISDNVHDDDDDDDDSGGGGGGSGNGDYYYYYYFNTYLNIM